MYRERVCGLWNLIKMTPLKPSLRKDAIKADSCDPILNAARRGGDGTRVPSRSDVEGVGWSQSLFRCQDASSVRTQ